MKLEILAPAGGRDSVEAAVRCGADAVYLGTKVLNARRNAANFDGEDLRETVRYCHERGVKVHLTVNTLVYDSEIPQAVSVIEEACRAGVDAVIVQDMGVAVLCRKICPELPMHASTQMAVHNLEGALQAKELGFSRVVLAREMSCGEIRRVAEQSGMETEVFVHGALCMCVSGQCYLSAMVGERSGNRGLCAQPCRLPHRAGGSGGSEYALSLKDMCLIPHMRELEEMGVTSLKIEGRMKRPEYVSPPAAAEGRSWSSFRRFFPAAGLPTATLPESSAPRCSASARRRTSLLLRAFWETLPPCTGRKYSGFRSASPLR